MALFPFSYDARNGSYSFGHLCLGALYMIEHRRVGRSSVITGSSIHNQRIKRWWRDVRRAVVGQFQNVFYYLEECGLLNPENENDLYALHYVYISHAKKCIMPALWQHYGP